MDFSPTVGRTSQFKTGSCEHKLKAVTSAQIARLGQQLTINAIRRWYSSIPSSNRFGCLDVA